MEQSSNDQRRTAAHLDALGQTLHRHSFTQLSTWMGLVAQQHKPLGSAPSVSEWCPRCFASCARSARLAQNRLVLTCQRPSCRHSSSSLIQSANELPCPASEKSHPTGVDDGPPTGTKRGASEASIADHPSIQAKKTAHPAQDPPAKPHHSGKLPGLPSPSLETSTSTENSNVKKKKKARSKNHAGLSELLAKRKADHSSQTKPSSHNDLQSFLTQL